MRRSVFLAALCALAGCSVGDFPVRRDAGVTVDVTNDIAAPLDVPVLPDAPMPDAPDAPDVADSGNCASGMLSCGGACTDVATDNRNCGTCGNACATGPNATTACRAGACVLTCSAGFADCDGSAADGCEADLNQSPNCGACRTTCNEPTPQCAVVEPTGDAGAAVDASADAGADAGVRYACRSGCSGSTTRCNTSCVDTQTSLANCGSCGNACPAVPSATPTCAAGACGFTCATNFANCDGSAANGCEADTRTSTAHCGMCANACPTGPNATPTCAAGACGIVCAAGYADCDGNPANGCEIDTRVNPSHCGMCANACASGPNSAPRCASGACSITCSTDFSDCDGVAATGCEVNIRTSASNCGMCARLPRRPQRDGAVLGGRVRNRLHRTVLQLRQL